MNLNTNVPSNPERETFEQFYSMFFDALETLSKSADEQCDIMGWYNVAWELKDDISIGRCVLEFSHQYLSNSQQNAIRNFLTEIEKLPDEIFHEAKTKEEHLNSMKNTRWEPIRAQATELIQILTPITEANKSFFENN